LSYYFLNLLCDIAHLELLLMPTVNQLVRKGRKTPFTRTKVPAMESCPQKKRSMY
jgi:ribosomal protein S12